MSFSKEYEQLKKTAEKLIAKRIEVIENYPEPLMSSIKYSLLDGGKRIRPVLFLQAFKTFCRGELPESAAHIAFAIECIHTYSLIHDDLPAMDNDDFRRGKPTNHKIFGEGIAILAGDALLNLAYESLFTAISLSNADISYVKAAKGIAVLCGGDGLIGGQTLDITAKNDTLTPNVLNYIYTHKTGDLIEAAVYSGALTGGADEKQARILSQFAQGFGFAFQIKDDILDYKSGVKHEIKSFVDIYGLEHSENMLNKLIGDAVNALSGLNADTVFFKEFALQSINRDY